MCDPRWKQSGNTVTKHHLALQKRKQTLAVLLETAHAGQRDLSKEAYFASYSTGVDSLPLIKQFLLTTAGSW